MKIKLCLNSWDFKNVSRLMFSQLNKKKTLIKELFICTPIQLWKLLLKLIIENDYSEVKCFIKTRTVVTLQLVFTVENAITLNFVVSYFVRYILLDWFTMYHVLPPTSPIFHEKTNRLSNWKKSNNGPLSNGKKTRGDETPYQERRYDVKTVRKCDVFSNTFYSVWAMSDSFERRGRRECEVAGRVAEELARQVWHGISLVFII